MSLLQLARAIARTAACAFAAAAGLSCATCVADTRAAAMPGRLSVALAPLPEQMAARDAWRIAESFCATRADCEVMLGRGGSMLPLYPDRTVLIVQRLPMAELQTGMIVVFIGDRGAPVAHTLLHKTPRGWTVRGLANAEPDRTLVKFRNYLGTVVRAFTPVMDADMAPLVAESPGHAQ